MASTACTLCAVYRPDAEPRAPYRAPVCEGDRRLLDHHLADIRELYDRLTRPEPPDVDDRSYRLPGDGDEQAADPLAALGGAGPVPGRSGQPRVSGSRNPAPPVPSDRIDLTLPARPATRRLFARGVLGLDGDQVGHLSVATILDTWVRDWRDRRWFDQHLPAATVADLVHWLRTRLDDACTSHPAIDEFAAEIRAVRSALRRAVGEADPAPEADRYARVPCRRCDLRGVLMRRPGDVYIECGSCGVLMTDGELTDWVERLAG